MEFFRHCPECGRKFHIKLESKKLVTSHEESIPTIARVHRGSRSTATGQFPLVNRLDLLEGPPVIVDVEEFQYAYRCKHCGHEWSEKRIKEQKEG
jgi:DNA-directed RNA polymerase subunit RPC12/RpoP